MADETTLKTLLSTRVRHVVKPWGSEERLSVMEKYALKLLHLQKGARFSLQYEMK